MNLTASPPDLATVLVAVQDTVGYLRAATEAPPGDGWFRCGALIGDPDSLAGLIRSTGAGRGTDDPQVAASLFFQAYAFRIGGVVLAAHALGYAVPDPSPRATAIAIARSRPSSIAFLSREVQHLDPPALVDAVVDGHLRPMVDAIRGITRVGERLLWGNAAASFATAFRAVEGAVDPERAAIVRERAATLFAAAPVLAGLGAFRDPDPDWSWTRTNCCLWYRTAEGRWCDDCSIPGPDRTLELTRAAEEAADA